MIIVGEESEEEGENNFGKDEEQYDSGKEQKVYVGDEEELEINFYPWFLFLMLYMFY